MWTNNAHNHLFPCGPFVRPEKIHEYIRFSNVEGFDFPLVASCNTDDAG